MTNNTSVIVVLLLVALGAELGESVRNCFSNRALDELPPIVKSVVFVGGEKDTVRKKLSHGGMKMGKMEGCDDGKTHLEVDWNPLDTDPYTCRAHERAPGGGKSGHPVVVKHTLFQPIHQCMQTRLRYLEAYPTSGAHRPVWPNFGRYRYIPPQRWIHSLEHGGIVFLYHPCSDPMEVADFIDTVKSKSFCGCKFIITPYRVPCDDIKKGGKSSEEMSDRPFALLYWGYSLHMYHFDRDVVAEFIQKYQRTKSTAPEHALHYDGGYSEGQISGGCGSYSTGIRCQNGDYQPRTMTGGSSSRPVTE